MFGELLSTRKETVQSIQNHSYLLILRLKDRVAVLFTRRGFRVKKIPF